VTPAEANAKFPPHPSCLAPERCCGATSLGRVTWYLCAACGCARCPEGSRGIILADSEDWRRPVCPDCFDAVHGNPDWDGGQP